MTPCGWYQRYQVAGFGGLHEKSQSPVLPDHRLGVAYVQAMRTASSLSPWWNQ